MRRLATVLLSTMVMLVGLATAASAHHYNGVHWRHHQAGQLHVFLEDHASAKWTEALEHARYQWSRSPYVSVSVVAKCPARAEVCIPVYSYYKNDHHLGHADWGAWPCDWPTTPPYPGRCHIVWAKVRVNNYEPTSRWLRKHVVTHEVGHVLGLGHSRYRTSVMHFEHLRTTPDAHDFATLGVYRHRHAS